MAQASSNSPQIHRGIIKLVLSGDTVVIRGQPRGGPPPERTLALSYITAPKLGRRGGGGSDSASTEVKDEPFAWDAREYLRILLIGKDIQFAIEHKTTGGREYGAIWINKDGERISVTELLVSEGLVEVRQANVRPSEELTKLIQLESDAKVQGKGKWIKSSTNAVRKVNYSVDNLRQYADKNHGKQLDAVVEHVRDACTLRAIVVPSYDVLTVAMTGIKCPSFKKEGDKDMAEPFAEQAKFFVESRLLQRDVKLLIEGVSSQNIIMATVIHPAGNIGELLLQDGFAWCVDWSMAMVTNGKDKLRAAEKQAKSNKTRYWRDYQPKPTVTSTSTSLPSNNFFGKVVEVVNADALVVKTDKGQFQKVFFSSFRPPRKSEESSEQGGARATGERTRPLYDIPFMFEAREFLRKKLIGKRVNVLVDYIKPAQDQFPERVCCTIMREDVNIGEALINKGYGTCLKHGRNDDQRSSHYDDLLTAENRAIKNKKGVHSKKDSALLRVADVSGDPSKAKQFLPFLQRAGRTTALVEFVASGSRMKLYLPKDTCLVNFILAGVSCPRAGSYSDKQKMPAEPYGQEAMTYTKELVMQREVDVEVESCDKGGNFIGWMFVDGHNLAVSLLENGYCKSLPQAERSQYSRQLLSAEDSARDARKRLWESYTEPTNEKPDESEEGEEPVDVVGGDSKLPNGTESKTVADRKTNYKKVIVTEVVSGNHFWAQSVDQGPQFDTLMEQLRTDLMTTPPLVGSYVPRKGSLCAAKFTDGLWYRASVEKVVSPQEVQILFVDFGNRLTVSVDKLVALPPNYSSQPPLAKEYQLACVQLHTDEEWQEEVKRAFQQEVLDQTALLNIEYKLQGTDYVTLLNPSQSDRDIGQKLIDDGLAFVGLRKDKKLQSLVTRYREAEDRARKNHVNIWLYGDFTEDNASEFGYKRQ